jgi:hypothetical protein
MHALPLESPLPNIVVAPIRSDINIAAIYVKSATPPKCFDLFLIPLVLVKFTSWQDMFSLYRESFTPEFCAEAPDAESVN